MDRKQIIAFHKLKVARRVVENCVRPKNNLIEMEGLAPDFDLRDDSGRIFSVKTFPQRLWYLDTRRVINPLGKSRTSLEIPPSFVGTKIMSVLEESTKRLSDRDRRMAIFLAIGSIASRRVLLLKRS